MIATRRELVLGGTLAATAGIAWACQPRIVRAALSGQRLEQVVPTRVAGWTGAADEADMVLPPFDEQQAAAVYEEQLARAYGSDADPTVLVVIAYDRSQSGLLMVHRPEICYPGSGFTIAADRPVTVDIAAGRPVGARFLSTAKESRLEQVLYWTRIADEFPQTGRQERLAVARLNLAGVVPDGVLVRLSTLTADPAAGLELLGRFARALYGACGPVGRALLAGGLSGG